MQFLILAQILRDTLAFSRMCDVAGNYAAADRCLERYAKSLPAIRTAANRQTLRTAAGWTGDADTAPDGHDEWETWDEDPHLNALLDHEYDNPNTLYDSWGEPSHPSMFSDHPVPPPTNRPQDQTQFTSGNYRQRWNPRQFVDSLKSMPGVQTQNMKTLPSAGYEDHYWVLPGGETVKLPGFHADSVDHVKQNLGIDDNDPINNAGDYSFFINGSGGSIRVYVNQEVDVIAHGLPDQNQIAALRQFRDKYPKKPLRIDYRYNKFMSNYDTVTDFEAALAKVKAAKGMDVAPAPVRTHQSPIRQFFHDERQWKLDR